MIIWWWLNITEKPLALFVLVCFCVAGIQFLVSSGPPPFGGSGVFRSCCIYASGLIQAVVFYLRVVVLCSVVLIMFGVVGGGDL